MLQHVNEPTHVHGHTLDVVITQETDKIVSCLDVSDPGLFDKSGKIRRDHWFYWVYYFSFLLKNIDCWYSL